MIMDPIANRVLTRLIEAGGGNSTTMKIATSDETLADRTRTYFEETAVELQKLWDAPLPKFRVIQKKVLAEYTMEVSTQNKDIYDRKVSCQIDQGAFRFVIESWSDETNRRNKIGSGSTSVDVSPKGLAKAIDGAISSSAYTYG